ncbi:MAG TPA: hypothetical protein VLT86_08000 [Vicinamibacterales bacterium]|nr:hypothetical protein [Vicinamibacterales bacterium]
MRGSLSVGILVSVMCLAPAPGFAGPRQAERQALAQQSQQTPPPATTPQETPAAQGRGAGRPDGPAPRPAVDMAKMQTVQDMLEGFEINQADRVLQLTDKQYGDFIQRLRSLQRLRRQHQNQRQRLVVELRRLSNQQPPVEDALLEAPTKRLDDFDKRAFQEIEAAYAQIDEVLNVRQRARFRLFEEQMEQRKLEILARVLKSGAPAPAPKTIK